MNRKRGISLIEVVVALGIIAIVFAGTITLIISVVNLEMSARARTEAVAITQKYLALNVHALGTGCQKNNIAPIDDSSGDPYQVTAQITSVGDDLVTQNNDGGFLRIEIITTWNYKSLGQETYNLAQVVRK